jgi:sugar O-acyltransferase (sialic acid O-acetyltransferase NeuD family)
LIVIGAGGHAKVVVETAQASGWSVLGTADDNAEARVFDLPHLGPPEALQPESGVQCVIAIGSNETRTRLAERLSGRLRWAILVHPAAIISSRASLGDGTVVFAGAVIQPGVQIGQQVIINTRASVDHDCHLGNGVHIGPGAVLTGGVNLGNGVFIGAGSVVSPGVTVGEWSTLGAGGVAIRDLEAHQTFVGVPARLITRADPRV